MAELLLYPKDTLNLTSQTTETISILERARGKGQTFGFFTLPEAELESRCLSFPENF